MQSCHLRKICSLFKPAIACRTFQNRTRGLGKYIDILVPSPKELRSDQVVCLFLLPNCLFLFIITVFFRQIQT